MTMTTLSVALVLLTAGPTAVEWPEVLDPRLSFTLFAAEPEIVTPTGIAVEPDGRVLVIESHTHFRPEGYKGPTSDRIRAFEDTDGDGRADRIRTAFEGTSTTMGLAVHPSGALFVATRREIFRLEKNEDGTYGRKTPIARLETAGNYPHNGLSGFAIDFAGNLVFGLGENLGESYRLIGSDGTTLAGGGEGGNIYRCAPDGTNLVHVATGFWNPFHLAFDAFGRLFAVDNDPDSRPPCRLLHIVAAGDYGYRFRNGRKGLHPFTAWNGELPGTLPMVAGTGEAPSGIVAYESDHLPADYRGDLLVTSWGDHRIERFRLSERGASMRSTAEAIVRGGENFRPVGIAAAPDGSLFVSDWVDKSYPVHGKGRVWHLRAARPETRSRPSNDREALAHADRGVREAAARRLAKGGESGLDALRHAVAHHADPRARALALEALAVAGGLSDETMRVVLHDRSAEVRALAVRLRSMRLDDPVAVAASDPSPAVRAEALRLIRRPEGRPRLLEALEDPDPFLSLAAREGLKRSASVDDLLALAKSDRPARRQGVLLILRESHEAKARSALPTFLDDPDPTVRFAAIQWVGEQRLSEFRAKLVDSLSGGSVTRPIFEATLAALEQIDGVRRRADQEFAGEEYVARLLLDPKASVSVRRRALRALRPDHPALTLDRLRQFLKSDDRATALEAVRSLRESPRPERFSLLTDLAERPSAPPLLRAEAIVGLSGDEPRQRALLVALATDPGTDRIVRAESLRSLQGSLLSDGERDRIKPLVREHAPTADLAARVVGLAPSRPAPPSRDLDAWLEALEGPADAAAGERIFFHPKGPGCYRCHAVDGRGGTIGPDLSTTTRALTRTRLVESILQPSKEVAPQFVPWTIARSDGTVLTGVLLRETPEGEQTYANTKGETFTLKTSEIEQRRPMAGSIMPDDLARTLTVQEFRDLIAFLRPAE